MSEEASNSGSALDSREEFGLGAPGGFGNEASTHMHDATGFAKKATKPVPPSDRDDDPDRGSGSGGGNWKGFDEEEPDPEPDINFGSGKKIEEDELDMTPMVDVTFLLLIFFMVTASFTLRKSFEQAHSQVDDPSEQVAEPPEEEDDFVEVIIDQTNTFYIRTRDQEEIEAPSDLEMRDTLRDAKESYGARRLIIRAHEDALHSNVVKVLDAASTIGIARVQTVVTDVDY